MEIFFYVSTAAGLNGLPRRWNPKRAVVEWCYWDTLGLGPAGLVRSWFGVPHLTIYPTEIQHKSTRNRTEPPILRGLFVWNSCWIPWIPAFCSSGPVKGSTSDERSAKPVLGEVGAENFLDDCSDVVPTLCRHHKKWLVTTKMQWLMVCICGWFRDFVQSRRPESELCSWIGLSFGFRFLTCAHTSGFYKLVIRWSNHLETIYACWDSVSVSVESSGTSQRVEGELGRFWMVFRMVFHKCHG